MCGECAFKKHLRSFEQSSVDAKGACSKLFQSERESLTKKVKIETKNAYPKNFSQSIGQLNLQSFNIVIGGAVATQASHVISSTANQT